MSLRSFSLLVQRKRTKRKDPFSEVFLPTKRAKPQDFPKFSPSLRKFLTENLVILRKKTTPYTFLKFSLHPTEESIEIWFKALQEPQIQIKARLLSPRIERSH
jgi:hypothetical protein